MASANIKEVARYAGVSLGAVSNVLNRPDVVAPTTRRRVLDAIGEPGYVRNDSARRLRAGRSQTVAIVVLDVSNAFFTDVIHGAEAVVESAGGMLVVRDRGSGHPSRCSVAVDDVAGGRLAAEHLAGQGHDRILYVGGPLSIRQVADRRAGATLALMSSVSRPRARLGRTAAELLLEESFEGEKHSHRHVVFQPELVVRASSHRGRGHR
ncbi:LacI family DNA-binding transcriptional regulator [Microbispora sp. NPDC049633]|uniref:LacI family DNA-binding transcriptional regulator n=1 Tax=Microbispora sp. NPDC049633 TaxID=3154355 RepID=UPI00341C126B